ncbi:unnamed protein product [Brassicogethes aeneus]|uniref:Sodium/calcium exchanger membrane region domain-containing protein n=1 Tax=Brassicogethes aeneus TaxID=1431903 RepID=A0A9P0B558_BRAAE|nr:unnamed protein product [Brassicogethes aeneus]
MRRTRRHKFLRLTVFFFLYSVIHVMSAPNQTAPAAADEKKPDAPPHQNTEEKHAPDSVEKPKSTPKPHQGFTTKPPTKVTTVKPHEATTTKPPHVVTTVKPPHEATTVKPHSTAKPNNVTTAGNETEECTPPAIKQFPHPIMGPTTRKHGGLIVHITVAVYMFLGLAIVCDEYFVASLDRICEELKMSPDVAGATFMAAGSSAPELATVIIGVFFAKDDIGISGVIGSAVFNIMFVISTCALCSGAVVYLNWYPLCRDCFFYALSILVMLFVIYDKYITWGESLVMLITYVIYCVVLHFNTEIERWAQTLPVPFKQKAPCEQSGLVSYKTLDDNGKVPNYGITPEQVQDNGEQKGGLYAVISWAVVYPIHYLCRKTMPDCRSERYRNWYPFTFFVSMVWISFYSYFMVWMITIIGYTMGIPDTVMGLTFVAAGVSVPDALSSIAVIKEGYGDMAVSNAVGSNVFDILICLGLPWFIKTAIIKPGSTVRVISKGLTYSTLSLLSTVVFLVVATHMNGWKLDKRFGVILMIWYLIFITFASMYELNVFGPMNPPECATDW